MAQHTVEKIGGSSMTRFGEVMQNVILGNRVGAEVYQRIFVVSAYGGITNLLLENKKTGAPGVYAYYASNDDAWMDAIEMVRTRMKELNAGFEELGLNLAEADAFVDRRIDGVKDCLEDLRRVSSYGHLVPETFLPACMEMLSALGESHSARNSAAILQQHGVNAICVDLARWRETEVLPLDTVIRNAFKDIDLSTCLPVVTGYVKCDVGIMAHFARGYSEITFSKIAALTGAREGIIHKEFHLSTGDPVLLGADKVRVIGNTNFDIADQMSDMQMEAIHSRASKEMQQRGIPIRVKNAFDPEHPGTLIHSDYVSPEPKVEMICGRDDLVAFTVTDSDMVGATGYDRELLDSFVKAGISYIAKNTNANTITHFVPDRPKALERCKNRIIKRFPEAQVRVEPVAIVSVLGTNMRETSFLARASHALGESNIELLAMNVSTSRVNMQFVVSREDFEPAQLALHAALVEQG